MVKSSNVSKRISTNMVPLIVSFFAGFIVNRLMNHQDVITGDVTEGLAGWVIGLLQALVVGVGLWVLFDGGGLMGLFGCVAICSLYFMIEGIFNLKNESGGINTDGWDRIKGSLITIGICFGLGCIKLLDH